MTIFTLTITIHFLMNLPLGREWNGEEELGGDKYRGKNNLV
jgi:hypothetical protein